MSTELSSMDSPNWNRDTSQSVEHSSAMLARTYSKMPLTDLVSFALPYLQMISKGSIPHRLRPRLGDSDLVQDTILGAAQSLPQFRGNTPESLKSWLKEIFQNRLRNLVRDHVRCQKRSVLLEEPIVSEPVQKADSVLDVMGKQETDVLDFQKMHATFQLLPAQHQQIIELHSRLGFSMAHISEKLRLPEPTVRKRYNRAIRRWRTLVDG